MWRMVRIRGSQTAKSHKRGPIVRVGSSGNSLIYLAFLGASLGLFPRVAQAQTPAYSATVEDVVVTAPEAPAETLSDQQVQVLQSKPVSATVVTEQQLQADQITNLEQAKKLEPALQFKALNIQNLTYNIRGFGNATYSQITSVLAASPSIWTASTCPGRARL
jgi:iron complex outermembrane recepter protein